MRLAIISRPRDAFADAVQLLAAKSGETQVLRFDLNLDGRERFAIDADGVHWHDSMLSNVDAVLMRGLRYQYPVVPRLDDDLDFSLWQTDYLAEQQRYSACASALRELERLGVRVMNPLHAIHRDFVKPVLLLRLAARGFAMPAWLTSNDVAEVEAFCAQHPHVRWHPVTGRGAWQRFEARQRADLIAPAKPPVLLAGGAGERVIRSYVCCGKVVASLAQEAASFEDLERLERFANTPCPWPVAEIERLYKELGLDWFEATFIGDDRAFLLYDIEADPRPEELPECHRDAIAAHMLAALNENPFTLVQRSQPVERKALFLRRALQMLFEMEDSKYR